MSYEKLEPHGRLTIAGAEFAWDFYARASIGNLDENGNAIITPTLIQYQLVLMTQMATGETRKSLLKVMHLREDDDVNELMRWMLWAYDYFMRELAISYGTKPRSALIIARKPPMNYKVAVLPWINHYRARKSYHTLPTLLNSEKQVNSLIRRLTGAYPRDYRIDLSAFQPNTFTDATRAVITNTLFYQLFLPSTGCPVDVSEQAFEFWRIPDPAEADLQTTETLGKCRVIRILKSVEFLEEKTFDMVGLDMYPANLTCYFVQPKDFSSEGADGAALNVNASLRQLEKQLNGKFLHDCIQKLLPQRTKRTVEVMMRIPLFQVHVENDLEWGLRTIGLDALFDPKNKDWTNLFEGMNPDGGDFHLNVVKQNCTMMLQATSLSSNYYMKALPKKNPVPENYAGRQFTLNKPFLYFIYDHFSRVFLIFGRVQNPCEKRAND